MDTCTRGLIQKIVQVVLLVILYSGSITQVYVRSIMLRAASKLWKPRWLYSPNLVAEYRHCVRTSYVASDFTDLTRKIQNSLVTEKLSAHYDWRSYRPEETTVKMLAFGLIVANCSKKSKDEEGESSYSNTYYV